MPDELDTWTLPLAWTAAMRLPTLGHLLPPGTLAWPRVGQQVVTFKRRAFDDDAELAETSPELVIAEVEGVDGLRRLLRIVYEHRLAGLALVRGAVPPSIQAEVLGLTREFAVFEAPGPGRELDPEASRTLADLVRRRVYRTLIARWNEAFGRHVGALRALGDGMPVVEADLSRPVMAPLSTIERVHIDGVLGLWLPAHAKPARQLGVSHGRLRRATSELPPALVRATTPPAVGSLRALVVEDDRQLGPVLKRLFERNAARQGRQVEVELVGRSDEAQARIERDGAPELLCVDVGLESPEAGVRLLEWLRRSGSASVVMGKSGGCRPEAVRALWRLGAFGVWAGDGVAALEREVASLFDAADDTAALRASAREAQALGAALEAQVRRGLVAAELVRQAGEARSIVRGLETDLVELPPGSGDAPARLDTLRAEAGARALGWAEGNHSAAARLLGVDVGTLQRLVRASR